MISKTYIESLLLAMGYLKENNLYEKKFAKELNCSIKVDLENENIIYPENEGMKVYKKNTCNFSFSENFVVLECITRLLDKGYRPEHISLEKEWTFGHDPKGGRADICISGQDGKTLFIIECKTFGKEYEKEYQNMLSYGGQLFSYWQQEKSSKFLVLYASRLEKEIIEYTIDSINCSDDANIIKLSEKDDSIKLFKNATTSEALYSVWNETYEKRFSGDVIFREDSSAYQIGIKPLRKLDLRDFREDDKIVNKFEEILRHNNVSDKENAFNRLVALFICKLVDEIQKNNNEVVDFQYKIGTDTYESLQDRLQRLHKEGMEKFMKEEIFYVSDDYAENLVQQFTGQNRKNMIHELQNTLRILKFYTNNDFAFKDVHNEELFLQNGKILVEVVQLFERFRIIGSANLQILGDLFEQLLNKGFKQNEGQFFTPIPITRFIWNSLPIENVIKKDGNIIFPKVIDYACGAGHFLTEGFKAILKCMNTIDDTLKISKSYIEKNIYGIEKDYRLSRVSKISLFMHGLGEGNIIFGDGLENYEDKNIKNNTFDILVANPPYSVSSFKPHLKIKNNHFSILEKISNSGSEIETLFIERISQLLKPDGIAAVILPTSILNKENESFIMARENLLKNFKIKAIILFGSKTFGATATNTITLFLEKYSEPPKKINLVEDSVEAIFKGEELTNWEDEDIFEKYLKKINVNKDEYNNFIKENYKINEIENKYFKKYKESFFKLSKIKIKQKQKIFQALEKIKQEEWYTKEYYKYVKEIEKEKLKYFSLVYNQRTLIVVSPDDSKEQEGFLGYSWSNRKGQEGIQIKDSDSILYNPKDRFSSDTISNLVKKNFYNEEIFVEKLNDYYYYLNTKDMLNFNDIIFNKVIKTTKIKNLKDDPNLETYYLSDSKNFELLIGERVLSEELIPEGNIPVYSANVYEEFGKTNKQNLKDYKLASIIWGIDGDWMVNVIPSNKPFYPTDHCGVLRIKNNNILPEYMKYALQVEGENERFSRNNRASLTRIQSLIIQIPKIDIQVKIINEIKKIDENIEKEKRKIKEYDKNIQTKFLEIFDLNSFINDGISTKYNLFQVEQLCYDGRGRIINQQYINENKGQYPVYSSQTTNNGIFGYINTFDFDGEFVTWTTDGVKAGTVFYRNGKFNCTNVCGTLKAKNEDINMRYLAYILNLVTSKYVNRVGNNKLMNDDMKKILIPLPDKNLQNLFAEEFEKSETSKLNALKQKESFENEKNNLINKYFR